MADKIFADGFIMKPKNDKAPDWVIGKMSIKVDEAIAFLQSNQKEGWVNLDLLMSQKDKPYAALDTFVPVKQENSAPEPINDEEDDEDLPF
jgi:hypothetical protein